MTLPAAYFERLYEKASDPWSLAERWYEERKYAVTLSSLPRPRFRRAFEPGCSVGVLTQLLARRCDELISTDVAAQAVAAARRRIASLPNVTVGRMEVPKQWPDGEFDLIVLSELGYYLSPRSLVTLIDRVLSSLTADGTLVAVHWRHPVADYPLTGDEVHTVLCHDQRLARLAEHVEADFRLEVFTRPGVESVAAVEGLVDTAEHT